MGVSWAVSGLAKGLVEYADNPAFLNPRVARGVGLGPVPIDDAALQVRIVGLKPATRYWYRTITTPFAEYPNAYLARPGEPVASAVHSFTTLGAAARGRFCMICDTHASWPAYRLVCRALKALEPTVVVWNGDAAGPSTQTKREAVGAFLDPPVEDADWAADAPALFTCGNHDVRGSWPSRLGEVMLPRDPSERRGDQWDLKWNFAVRLGDMALVGLDTGEDKPDAHPMWFGLAAFEPYRRKQAEWLAEQLRRSDIAEAKAKVAFCHIPLFAAPDHPDHPHDGTRIDPDDYAYWSRECAELWGPILADAGVRLVVCGHKHRFRYDPPTADRPWAQVVGGGPDLGTLRGRPDDTLFPTVVEGWTEGDALRLRVHDVHRGRVVLDETLPPA
ncbi:MAG: metallophosphoesterase [Kiritimatiellae bacterium]|nr:metallophosphoesterase [Kiritimatiellia bacterium]